MNVYEQFKRDLTRVFLAFTATNIVILCLYDYIPFRRDATDGTTRSGMSLHTDAETGLQYLGRRGSLTPRMGSDGRQMRVEGKQR